MSRPSPWYRHRQALHEHPGPELRQFFHQVPAFPHAKLQADETYRVVTARQPEMKGKK